MPSRSLARPLVAVVALAALVGFVGRTGSYLPLTIDLRGAALSFVILGLTLAEVVVGTLGAVAVGYLLVDGRNVVDRLWVTVLAVALAALLGHALGVAGAIATQPPNVSLPEGPVVLVAGLLLGSLAGSLPLTVGVVAGAAVARLRTTA